MGYRILADERVNIHKSLIEGGTDFKGNDEGNRIQHPLPKHRCGSVKQKLYYLGRNEPCGCGSGIKFKKCCIDKEK